MPPDEGVGGTRKEVHNHYSNGSSKLVWVWACGVTVLLVSGFGYIADKQWETNDELREAVTDLGERVGRLELQIDNLQRTIERERE